MWVWLSVVALLLPLHQAALTGSGKHAEEEFESFMNELPDDVEFDLDLALRLSEAIFPYSSLAVDGDSMATTYRKDVHRFNSWYLSALEDSERMKTIFSGECVDDLDCGEMRSSVGLALSVFKHQHPSDPTKSFAVVSIRGAFTEADYQVEQVWYAEWLAHHQRKASLQRWKDLGYDVSDLDLESPASAAYNELEFYIANTKTRANIAEKLANSHSAVLNEIGEDEFQEELYWPVAKATWMAVAPHVEQFETVHLTGQGLGGTIASLIHMWQDSMIANGDESALQIASTTTFGSPGVQCFATDYMRDDIDFSRTYPAITNYVNDHDPVALIDYSPGRVCTYSKTTDKTAEVCSKAFGEGLSLFNQDTKVWEDFQECRHHAHDVYLLFDESGILSIPQVNCTEPVLASCPSTAPAAELVSLAVGFVALGLYILFFVVWVIPRLIYIKLKGKGELFPWRWCGPERAAVRPLIAERRALGQKQQSRKTRLFMNI